MLARKRQVLMPDQACETGTAPTASDKSAEGAADVRSTDGLWPVGGGAVNSNNPDPHAVLHQYDD